MSLEETCVTCSDEAVLARVVARDGVEALVQPLPAGVAEHVAVDLVPDAAAGDVLLCHAGIALEIVEPGR